jgi:hypothetical protein
LRSCVDGPRLARRIVAWRPVRVAVMCPALHCGHMTAGLDGFRGSGPHHRCGIVVPGKNAGSPDPSERPTSPSRLFTPASFPASDNLVLAQGAPRAAPGKAGQRPPRSGLALPGASTAPSWSAEVVMRRPPRLAAVERLCRATGRPKRHGRACSPRRPLPRAEASARARRSATGPPDRALNEGR